jgi:hypothetical protein
METFSSIKTGEWGIYVGISLAAHSTPLTDQRGDFYSGVKPTLLQGFCPATSASGQIAPCMKFKSSSAVGSCSLAVATMFLNPVATKDMNNK